MEKNVISRKQRIPFRDLSTLADDDRKMAQSNRPDGTVINITKTLLQHPKLARSWFRFARHVLFESTLPPREREMAILRIGWLNQAAYEWEQHVLIAKQAGLTDEEIERITKGPSAGWNRHDEAMLQA